MISVRQSLLQIVEGQTVLSIPNDVLLSLGWKAGHVLYIHADESDGIWLSAEDQSSMISKIEEAADEAILAVKDAHSSIAKIV